MLHIWHEDDSKSSTQQFWEFLKSNNVSPKLTNAEVRGFKGVRNLTKHIMQCNFNREDYYIIFIDYVLDNDITMKYYKKAKRYIRKYNNVILVKLLCFEYLMLTFEQLHIWTKPIQTAKLEDFNLLCQARQNFIDCIERKVNKKWYEDNILRSFMCKIKKITGVTTEDITIKLSVYTTEDVAYSLLSEITHRFGGRFSIEKTKLRDCWVCDCCKYPQGYPQHNKQQPCNIYRYKKDSRQKATNLWNCTMAKSIINSVR